MNTNEVVEMIDAITEGRKYIAVWDGARESDSLKVDVRQEMLSLSNAEESFFHEIVDPRAAREIAVALIAWANKRDGKVNTTANVARTNLLDETARGKHRG